MRQGQQNRRGRGRHNNGGHNNYSGGGNNNGNNNNNRKGQNPLARSYESNGPDVKIRGNPAHIAEKYMTLARDAQSSGDSVLAEAYLQHAEHYNRIIMAFREQQQQNGEGQYRQRPQSGEGLDGGIDGDDDGDDNGAGLGGEAMIRGQEPQPGIFDQPPQRFSERQPEQSGRDDRGNRDDRSGRGYDDRQPRRGDGNRDGGRRDRYGEGQRDRGYAAPRDDRSERRERFDRYQGQERPQGERGYQDRPPQERQSVDRPMQERGLAERPAPELQRTVVDTTVVVPSEAEVAPAPVPVPVREPREPSATPTPRRRAAPVADRFADAQQEQPEFLRRPVRRPRREAAAAPVDIADGTVVPSDEPDKE